MRARDDVNPGRRGSARRELLAYAVALAAVALVVAARWLFDPWLHGDVPYVTASAAVVIAVWFGGWRPAVFAAVLAYFACNMVFLEPHGRVAWSSLPAALLYVFTCSILIVLGEAMRAARRRADASREFQSVTLRSIGDAVITTDAHGRVTELNPVAEELTGWTTAAARGEPLERVFRIVNESTRATVENPVAKVIAHGRVVGLANHTILIAKDGRERPIDDSAAPIRGADGEIVGYVLVFRDISERHRAEAQGRERLAAARLLASIVESSDDAILSKSLDGVIRTWNAGATRIFGYTADEAIGKHISLIIPRDRLHEEDEILAKLRAGERIEHYETLRARKDGSLIPISVTISPVADEQGQVFAASKIARDIRARKDAEQALRDNEERLRLATRTGKVGIWEWDVALDRITWTDSLYELHGVDRAQFQGDVASLVALAHPEDRERVRAAIEASVASGDVYEVEYRTLRPDGTVAWIFTNAAVIRDGGRPVRLLGASLDVTERKRVEQQLREGERTQRVLADIGRLGARTGVADGMPLDELLRVVTERVRLELGVARCSFALLGRDDAALDRKSGPQDAGLPSTRFEVASGSEPFSSEGRAGRTTVIEDLAADPRTSASLARLYAPLGVRACVNVPLHREGRWLANLSVAAEAPRAWSTNEVDLLETIAQHLWLVIEQARAASALMESEQRFRQLADAAPVMIWISGSDQLFQWFNTTWLTYVGRTMEREMGVGWRENVHPDDLDGCVATYATAFAARRPFSMEYRLRRHDGEWRWVLDNGIPRYEPNGEFSGFIGTCTDIDELRDAEEALKEADRRKDEFLATLAHELRNPLAPIRNAIQVQLVKGAPDPELRWSVEVIDRQVQHMGRLLDDLLDVSRISRQRLVMRKERVELATLVRNAIETSRPAIDAARHALEVELPPAPIELDGDRVRLAQVFSNLLNNAAKYMDEGGRIRLRATRDRDFAVVSVRDEGIGIAPELLPRLFEIFTQAESALDRSQGGLGIGLSLARGLVELHGGTIEARSEGLGKGAEFVVRLPAIPAAAPGAEPATSAPAAALPARKRRVLVVDDLADNVESLAILLKLSGHEVDRAYGGEQALEIAEARRPDIVLLDIGMPKLNGYQVCERLRSHPWGQRMIVIALTGWGQESDRRRGEEAGFDAHLVKPLDAKLLAKLIDELSAKRL